MSQSTSPTTSTGDSSVEMAKSHEYHDGDLTEMLNETRVLLPGAQMLTAFLIVVPFNAQFQTVNATERWVYVITFLCSLLSLLLFAAPAAHHRLERPLQDRESFKKFSNRFVLAGLFALSVALVLSTQLVISQVYDGTWTPWIVSGGVAFLVLTIWWLLPQKRAQQLRQQMARVSSGHSKSGIEN